MTKYLHIALCTLLGTALLAGCHRAEDNGTETDPVQVTGEPVKVNLTLNVHGIGESGVLTKADYEDLDAARSYDFENNIVDCKLFVFKPANASASISDLFKVEGGKKVPKDDAFVRVALDEEKVLYYQNMGEDRWRLEFKLADTYKSLVVLALANVGTAADGCPKGAGSTLGEVIGWLQANGMDTRITNQEDYVDGKAGVFMHGMKSFGVEAELRYWRNMSTPLTVKGFKDANELKNYTETTGATREEDRLVLRHGMARLHVSYEPVSGQLPQRPKEVKEADDPQTFVEITSVMLHNYDTKVRFLPKHFWDPEDAQLNPFSIKDSLFTVLALQTTQGDLEFVRPKGDPTESGDFSWVAYVPEQRMTDNPTANTPYIDPYLIVEVTVTERDAAHKEKVTKLTFERDTITREWTWMDGSVKKTETRKYINSPWTEWLQMQNTLTTRKDIKGTLVPLGTYYHLVRNYSYEWIAEGLEGLVL